MAGHLGLAGLTPAEDTAFAMSSAGVIGRWRPSLVALVRPTDGPGQAGDLQRTQFTAYDPPLLVRRLLMRGDTWGKQGRTVWEGACVHRFRETSLWQVAAGDRNA